MVDELNYDEWISLDAEELAEGGIKAAYESLLPKLKEFVAAPATIREELDDQLPYYAVHDGTHEFVIFGPEIEDDQARSWGLAAYALFRIVNDQLTESDVRFFAISGGNDLGGMFLTPQRATNSRNALPRRLDWPYLPTDVHPWYGQYH